MRTPEACGGESSGVKRLTFDQTWLDAGLDVLPVMIGLFAVSQILSDIVHRAEDRSDIVRASLKGVFLSVRDYVVHGWTMLRSSLIGVGIGILPGVGATIASIVASTSSDSASARKPTWPRLTPSTGVPLAIKLDEPGAQWIQRM